MAKPNQLVSLSKHLLYTSLWPTSFNLIISRLCVLWFQIVHWRNQLKFPEDAKLSAEAKDLICRLLCDVEHRLGTGGGANQIKVLSQSLTFNCFITYFLFLLVKLIPSGLLSGSSLVQGYFVG